MLEIGSVVDGKYKILSKIGQGGMSVVYMAINEKANKTWAVKEVRKDGVLDFEAVKQGLVAETDILKKLNHPNLPSIIDVIDTYDSFIIIMDYIQGNPLSKSLEEYGALPQESVILWAKQLCDVLGYLHTRQPAIIYRDMKPSNIMLKPDGNVTLIDFGTAREFKEKNLADTTCLGTVGYAAPEQFGGMGQTDARTDIYCLGATLYHLITGCNPSQPPYDIYPIRTINPSLSGGLEKIIMKCTQRNPQDRYQNAEELKYALDHYEEIDDRFKKKQKNKLGIFLAAALLSVAFAICGFVCNYAAVQRAADTYANLLEEAEKTDDVEERIKIYGDCIRVPNKSGVKDAYLGLIAAYKSNGSFTAEDANYFHEHYFDANEAILKENPSDYTEVCFELGKLYWYYYVQDETNNNNNRFYRAKKCVKYFKNVITYAPDDYKNKQMAVVYSEIGSFYNNITEDVTEANEAGKYKPIYDTFDGLIDTVAVDENESEIVRLEVLETARSIIESYCTKLKTEGVTKTDLESMLDRIETTITGITTTAEKTNEIKQNTVNGLDRASKAVTDAFSTKN